jgi:hypothetical protein
MAVVEEGQCVRTNVENGPVFSRTRTLIGDQHIPINRVVEQHDLLLPSLWIV